jgi:FkbM family methyltransferase
MFGLEVRRTGRGFHADAYDDQKLLLTGRRDVRLIFDVGANTGQTARLYRKLFPEATIYCFEPFEEAYNKLCAASYEDSHIIPQRIAVADTPGHRTLFVNNASVTNSLLATTREASDYVDDSLIRNVGSVQVQSTTLEVFCERSGISAIPILKMDVQGAELLVLRGGSSLLGAGAIDLVYTEVSFVSLYEKQAVFHDLCEYLSGHRYALYGLYNLFTGRNGLLAQADAIFLSPRMCEFLRRT